MQILTYSNVVKIRRTAMSADGWLRFEKMKYISVRTVLVC